IAEGEALEKLTDDELLRKTAREVAIAVNVVAHAMLYKAEVMATKPAPNGPTAGSCGPLSQPRSAARSAQPPRPCMNWSKSFRKTPHRCCGSPACAGRRRKRSTPRTQSSGMSYLGAFSPAHCTATVTAGHRDRGVSHGVRPFWQG